MDLYFIAFLFIGQFASYTFAQSTSYDCSSDNQNCIKDMLRKIHDEIASLNIEYQVSQPGKFTNQGQINI